MTSDAQFPGLKPWPSVIADAVLDAKRHHNRPPLEEQVVLDFEDALSVAGLDERVRDIIASADRAPVIASEETCGQAGDVIAAAREAEKAVEAEREKLNRPLLTAQRALKAQADRTLAPMSRSVGQLRKRVDEFIQGQEEAVRGDMGARVGRQETWEFRIVDVGAVPVDIRFHPDVLETMRKVIAARIRSGTRNIAGVEIWPEFKARVR